MSYGYQMSQPARWEITVTTASATNTVGVMAENNEDIPFDDLLAAMVAGLEAIPGVTDVSVKLWTLQASNYP